MAVHKDFISVGSVGSTVTSGAASAFTAIPTLVGSVKPKYIRVQVDGFTFIKLGPTGTVATSNDLLVSPNEAAIISCAGADFVAYIQSTAAAKVNIIPLDA